VNSGSIDPLTCQDAVARLEDYLDRELNEEEMSQVRHHLEICAACAGHFRTEGTVLQQLRDKLRRIAVPGDLMARVQRKLGGE
jgi:anti-sigma factor (TIGR02949 family)